MKEEVKAKDDLKYVKKAKGLDFNLILMFFVMSLVTSVMFAFLVLISL